MSLPRAIELPTGSTLELMTFRNMLRLLIIVALIMGRTVAMAGEGRVYRLGVVMLIILDAPHVKGLREGLRQAGYIEGKNLHVDMLRKMTPDELRATVKTEIEKYDLVVTTGVLETRIAKEATEKIPIVFMPASTPVRAGFVNSLAHPGTNLTGITYHAIQPGTFGKQLEIFKQAVPTLRRLTLLYDDDEENPYRNLNIKEGRRVAAHLGIDLAERRVKSLAEGEQVVASLSRDATDGLAIICSSVVYGSKKLSTIARQKRIAHLACATEQVGEGGLLAYSPDLHWIGRRAAWYVDQILRGANPQDMPVESPSKFELAINLKTAKQIGVQIPMAVLMRADKVFR